MKRFVICIVNEHFPPLWALSNLSNMVEPLVMTTNASSEEENVPTILFELVPTKFRLNYFYYTIYLARVKRVLLFLLLMSSHLLCRQ